MSHTFSHRHTSTHTHTHTHTDRHTQRHTRAVTQSTHRRISKDDCMCVCVCVCARVRACRTIRIYSRSPSSASSIGERWHSPHPALGSSPGCIPSSSGSGAGGRTARYLSRRSTEQHRMSAGGSVDMGISRATPTSSGEVTAGMSAAKNVR